MIDPEGDRPVYLQVAQHLRERIVSGEWQPRRRLPSVVALEHEYGVARNTILKAIKRLRDTGQVYTVRNWGTVVKAGADYIAVVRMEAGSRGIFRAATEQEIAHLDLAAGSAVFVVERADGGVEVYPAETLEVRGGD